MRELPDCPQLKERNPLASVPERNGRQLLAVAGTAKPFPAPRTNLKTPAIPVRSLIEEIVGC